MRDLHQRVNARIGASGAHDANRLHGKPAQGFFQLVLDGVTGQLALPALISPTVVADSECNSHSCTAASSARLSAGTQLKLLKARCAFALRSPVASAMTSSINADSACSMVKPDASSMANWRVSKLNSAAGMVGPGRR